MASDIVRFEMILEEPNEELLDYAKIHLNEDPDTKLQVLEEFRDLIYERGECTPHRLDDAFLLRFLRARNFVVRHAHRLLVNYYGFRANNPEFFRNVYFDRLIAVGDANLISTQPFCEQTGRRILFYRLGGWDPKKITVTDLYQTSLVTLELGLLEPRAQILGGICIFDLGGIEMKHVKRLTPKIVTQTLEIIAWTYPVRTHAIHVVNQSAVFKTGYSIVKPFLTKEIKNKLFFHGSNMASLHKHINPEYLPKRYGGVHPDYGYVEWIDFIKSNPGVLKELRDLGYTLEDQLRSRSQEA